MIKSSFKLEDKLINGGYEVIIGIDEAGRGPLAGPVVAAAASFKFFKTSPAFGHPSLIKEGMGEVLLKQFKLIRDSKTLSHKQREKLFDFIHEHFYIGVGICDRETIDRINILEATFLAIKKAMADLSRNLKPESHKSKSIVLFDGNKRIPNFSMEQKVITNGDKLIKSISAASIIAKVTRDRIMADMHKKYPNYGFDRHKGYGTKIHMQMLDLHGPCEIHRRSFKPVGRILSKKKGR